MKSIFLIVIVCCASRFGEKRSRDSYDVEPSWNAWSETVFSFPASESAATIADWLPWNSSFPSGFKQKVVERIRQDEIAHREFSPSLDILWYLSQDTVLGKFGLSKETVITNTESSTIHNITQAKWIIKYQMDCLEEFPALHPLLIDYWFLEHVAPHGLAPRPIAISDQVALPAQRTLKTAFSIGGSVYRACVRMRSSVRYAIMEREGMNLHNFMVSQPGGKVPFAQAVKLGIDLIVVLKKLHEVAMVVHGDIHSGNVVFSADDPTKLVLIDFARANFLDDTLSDERVRASNIWNDALLSPWEIDGFAQGRRDDVFRALLLVAILMNGYSFYQHLSSLTYDLKSSLDIKLHRNIFLCNPGSDPLEALELEKSNIGKISRHLEDALLTVRSVPTRSDQPDHDRITAELRSVLEITSKV